MTNEKFLFFFEGELHGTARELELDISPERMNGLMLVRVALSTKEGVDEP